MWFNLPLLKKGHTELSLHLWRLLSASKDADATTSLGNLCQCLVTLTVKKCFLMFRGNLLCFSLCPLPLVLSLGTTKKSLDPSLHPPFRYWSTLIRSPEPSLLQAEQPKISEPFLTGEMLQSFNHLCGPLLDSVQYVHFSLVLGSSELHVALQMGPHQCWVEGKDHRSPPASSTPLDAAQDTISRLCRKDALLAYVQLGVHQEPQVIFSQAPSSWVDPSRSWWLVFFLIRCRILHFPLLNCTKFRAEKRALQPMPVVGISQRRMVCLLLRKVPDLQSTLCIKWSMKLLYLY